MLPPPAFTTAKSKWGMPMDDVKVHNNPILPQYRYDLPSPYAPSPTHLYMEGCTAYIPDCGRTEFYEWLAQDILAGRNRSIAICEVLGNKFRMCFDMDYKNGDAQPYETRESIMAHALCMQTVIKEFFPTQTQDLLMFICVSAKWKVHIYMPLLIVTSSIALELRQAILHRIRLQFGERATPKNSWAEVIDHQIYVNHSLRMIENVKYTKCDKCDTAAFYAKLKRAKKRVSAPAATGTTGTTGATSAPGTNATPAATVDTAAAATKARVVCPHCTRGKKNGGADSMYHLEIVIQANGKEDGETLQLLRQPVHIKQLLSICSVWHHGLPLSKYSRPFGTTLVPTSIDVLKKMRIRAAGGDNSKRRRTNAGSSSLYCDDSEHDEEDQVYGADVFAQDLDPKQRMKLLLPNDQRTWKERKTCKFQKKVFVDSQDQRLKQLETFIQEDCGLGMEYRSLFVNVMFTNVKHSIYFVQLGGPGSAYCRNKRGEHTSSTIYLQICDGQLSDRKTAPQLESSKERQPRLFIRCHSKKPIRYTQGLCQDYYSAGIALPEWLNSILFGSGGSTNNLRRHQGTKEKTTTSTTPPIPSQENKNNPISALEAYTQQMKASMGYTGTGASSYLSLDYITNNVLAKRGNGKEEKT